MNDLIQFSIPQHDWIEARYFDLLLNRIWIESWEFQIPKQKMLCWRSNTIPIRWMDGWMDVISSITKAINRAVLNNNTIVGVDQLHKKKIQKIRGMVDYVIDRLAIYNRIFMEEVFVFCLLTWLIHRVGSLTYNCNLN